MLHIRTQQGNVKLKHAVHCPRCNQILPPERFRYTIPRVHAAARGYSGDRPVTFTSHYCNKCRIKNSRPLSKLTIPEINERIAAGDIAPAYGQWLIDVKVKRKSKKCSEAVRKRWERPITQEWNDWISFLRHEARLIKRQRRYAVQTGDDNTIVFCDAAVDLVQEMIAILKTRKTLKHKIKPNEDPCAWPEPQRADTAKLWGQIVHSSTKPPRTPIFL